MMIGGGGNEFWELNGKRHRIDGPAVKYASGDEYWYLNGTHLNFQVWKVLVRQYYDTEEDYLLMLLKL